MNSELQEENKKVLELNGISEKIKSSTKLIESKISKIKTDYV